LKLLKYIIIIFYTRNDIIKCNDRIKLIQPTMLLIVKYITLIPIIT